jgi:death on curing protein
LAVRYLSVADVMALHNEMMEETGYRPAPLRDEGLLESAVLRPQTAAYYGGADLVRQAASLDVGIAQNQPYLDGNKRTAYIATTVFLRVNGLPFEGDRLALAREIEAVATRTDSLDSATRRLEDWLRRHVT